MIILGILLLMAGISLSYFAGKVFAEGDSIIAGFLLIIAGFLLNYVGISAIYAAF